MSAPCAGWGLSRGELRLLRRGHHPHAHLGGANDNPQQAGPLLGEMCERCRLVRRHVWLWGTFCGATISYLLFMGPPEVLLPYLVKHDSRAAPT